MICCFMNLHEIASLQDLDAHFDREIEEAVMWGCDTFLCGTKYPEDEIFARRIKVYLKKKPDEFISFYQVTPKGDYDRQIKSLFICLADREIYAYE